MSGLPDGFRVRVRDDIRILDGGRTLVGGSPLRLLRLREPAPPLRRGEVVEVADAVSRAVAARLLATNLADPLLTDFVRRGVCVAGPAAAVPPAAPAAPSQAGPGASDPPRRSASEGSVPEPPSADPAPLDGSAPGPADPAGRDPEVAELTVVIPVRDRAERLGRLLAGLRGLPVVVVDDASRDPAAVAAVVTRHGARLIALTTNLGPAGARNAGAAAIATPYAAFVDSDVVADPDTLRGLAGHFLDPQVAAVGPRVRGVARGATPRRFERWDVAGLSLDLGDRPALVRPWSTVGWLPSACLVVRTEDFAKAGGFTAGRRVGEDVDLVWRLIRAGRSVRYDPAYEVSHDSRGSWRTWLGRKAFYGSGGAWLARRHGDWMAPAVLSAVPAAATAALLAQRRWSVPAALVALLAVRLRLGRSLPDIPDRPALARSLTAEVSVSTLRQTSQLLLRHWWPAAAAACVVSRRARRAVAAALVWDLLDHREVPPRGAPDAFAARRCDDLAYGAGLWWGALRDRSPRVLLPRIGGRADPVARGVRPGAGGRSETGPVSEAVSRT